MRNFQAQFERGTLNHDQIIYSMHGMTDRRAEALLNNERADLFRHPDTAAAYRTANVMLNRLSRIRMEFGKAKRKGEV